jgi:hypothetical protein
MVTDFFVYLCFSFLKQGGQDRRADRRAVGRRPTARASSTGMPDVLREGQEVFGGSRGRGRRRQPGEAISEYPPLIAYPFVSKGSSLELRIFFGSQICATNTADTPSHLRTMDVEMGGFFCVRTVFDRFEPPHLTLQLFSPLVGVGGFQSIAVAVLQSDTSCLGLSWICKWNSSISAWSWDLELAQALRQLALTL